MFRLFHCRAGHYVLLLTVAASLYLPALGAASLWDIDEGNNAECAFEMWSRGDWITPYFNGEWRVDKPALLYWFQMAAYQVFGVGEFAARLPSALAALLTVLLTYELGRRLFDTTTALVSGLVLASALLFCGMAHFANPDALLNVCTVLTFLIFWDSYLRDSSAWLAWGGVSTGLAFLAKGPVGLVLPSAVIGLFLLWSRQLRRAARPTVLLGVLLWALVAVPWFALVGSETKGAFLRGFFLTHNVSRFTAPMEGHGGPFFYHALSLLLGFLPWSVFLLPTVRNTLRELRTDGEDAARPATRFLCCWFVVYFVFFSLSRTKLPNYVLPLYPAVALLTGRFLDRWRRGVVELSPRLWSAGLVCWALVGIGLSVGLLVASGAVDVPGLRHRFPGLEAGAGLGVVPVLGAAAAGLCLRRGIRTGALGSLGASAVIFVGGVFIWGAPAMNAHKSPQPLVAESATARPGSDIRIGCYEYFQPSLVFYAGRKVDRFNDDDQVREFLRCPLPAYLFVPARVWERLAPTVPGPTRLRGRHWDLYRNCEVVVISNGREE